MLEVRDGTYADVRRILSGLNERDQYFLSPTGRYVSSSNCELRLIVTEDNVPVAFLEGTVYSDTPRTMVISYAVLRSHRREGLAWHLIYKAMDRALLMGMNTLFARVDHDNMPSKKLLQNIGFHELCHNKEQISYVYELSRYTARSDG